METVHSTKKSEQSEYTPQNTKEIVHFKEATNSGGQSAQHFKGLDKSVKHFDAGDIQEICMARVS